MLFNTYRTSQILVASSYLHFLSLSLSLSSLSLLSLSLSLSLSLCFQFSLGWFKLLPTFGGCVITVSKVKLLPEGILDLEVDYTTAKQVEGLNGLGTFRTVIVCSVLGCMRLLYDVCIAQMDSFIILCVSGMLLRANMYCIYNAALFICTAYTALQYI